MADDDQWAVVGVAPRNDIYQIDAPFTIDGIVNTMVAKGKIGLERHEAIGVTRRALEVAVWQAGFAAEPLSNAEHRLDWQTTERLAQAALDANKALLAHLAGVDPVNEASLQRPLQQLAMSRKIDAAAAHAESLLEAGVLVHSLGTLRRLTSFAIVKGDRLAGGTNLGDPGKAAFVFTMAEAWVLLTGRIPGSAKSLSDNPFLRFARTAWLDMGGSAPSEESFGQAALSAARQKLLVDPAVKLPDFRPYWTR